MSSQINFVLYILLLGLFVEPSTLIYILPLYLGGYYFEIVDPISDFIEIAIYLLSVRISSMYDAPPMQKILLFIIAYLSLSFISSTYIY